MDAHRIETTINQDGTLTLEDIPFKAGDEVEVIIRERPPKTEGAERLRPFALCEGEFVAPDDFDAPLPEEVLSQFEGR